MRARNSSSPFRRSLGFALVSGLVAVPWLLLSAPSLGLGPSLSIFAAPALAAYLFVIAPRPAAGLRAAILAIVGVSVPWFLTNSSTVHLLSAALLLAMLRSGMLYQRPPTRALVLESVLGTASLTLASGIAHAAWTGASRILEGSALSAGLAVWSFFLVHSVFFVIADVTLREPEQPADAFEQARRKALDLLQA